MLVISHPNLKQFLKGKRCRWCDIDISQEPVKGYPHTEGWLVGPQKLWLYVTCPKCDYDWALWKLGLSRRAEFH